MGQNNAGLGESFIYSLNFYFESLSNVKKKNVNSAACLIIVCFVVGTWVTFGSQITDEVGRKECTCNITLLHFAFRSKLTAKRALEQNCKEHLKKRCRET